MKRISILRLRLRSRHSQNDVVELTGYTTWNMAVFLSKKWFWGLFVIGANHTFN